VVKDYGALNRLSSDKPAEISWPPTNVGKDWTCTTTTSTIPVPWRCSCPASFAVVAVAVAAAAAAVADASESRLTAFVVPSHNWPATADPWASRQSAAARNRRRNSANRYRRRSRTAIAVVRNPRWPCCRCSGGNRLRWTAAAFGNRHRQRRPGGCYCCTVAAGRSSWTPRRRSGRHGGVAAPATPDVAVVVAWPPAA